MFQEPGLFPWLTAGANIELALRARKVPRSQRRTRTLELLEETLRSAGYETQSVRSGARALQVLSCKLVSAVLLDLLMPGMDGFQVIRHVRQEPALKEMPILVMTAKNLSQDEIALLNRETQGLLQKDGSWNQQLIAEVGRVVRGRKRAKSAGQP